MRVRCLLLALVAFAAAGIPARAQPTPSQSRTPSPAQAAAPAVAPGLKVGDVAPDFTLPGSDGTTYRLADYKGVRPVIVAWFPRMPIKD